MRSGKRLGLGWRLLIFGASCVIPSIVAAAPESSTASSGQIKGQDPRVLAREQLEEQLAYHVGTLGYLYGFPVVDMLRNMHRETHRIDDGQKVLARLNDFYRFRERVTPQTSGSLRAPNSDTLYLSGWFDLRDRPVVIRAPDTAGRYYTLAVTDFFSRVQHVGRRTTGTDARDFVLVGPSYRGVLPAGLHVIRVPTHQAWVLGRVLVRGNEDLPNAVGVLDGFRVSSIEDWRRDRVETTATTPIPAGEVWEPLESLEFFEVLNRWLRDQPADPVETSLLAQFDLVGFGPGKPFVLSNASEATRRGLKRAIEDARTMLRAASRRPLTDVRNGWMFPLELGHFGHDYLMRATVAFGGYANLPEETVYAALTGDAQGRPLSGARIYRLEFPTGSRPPVGAFWSVTAYRLADFSLMTNSADRYSIGDHMSEFTTAADGSFSIRISREPPPPEARVAGENWLPVGDDPFYLILRLYEPGGSVFDRSYSPPPLREIGSSAGR